MEEEDEMKMEREEDNERVGKLREEREGRGSEDGGRR
jgi:hypothetical protein